jgi:hypothetical protein
MLARPDHFHLSEVEGEMLLTHLTAVGPGVPIATINFGSHLTVIYGASDTGKSYIAEAIDFVLGASKLKQIPEAQGYTHLLLSVSFPNEEHVTLVRPMFGQDTHITVYPGNHLQLPPEPSDIVLAAKHSPRSTRNVSRYLLAQIGLDGKILRRNAQNDCRLLSFRDLAMLCIIDETDMQSKTSPILSGQYINETVEKSVFKFLVDGVDDSNITSPNQSPDQRKVSRGKAELLDNLIEELRTVVTNSADPIELQQQLGRITSSVAELSESVSAAVRERDRLLAARQDARTRMSADRTRLAEVESLLARFTLLREQYESDLARLDMVREVGDLLGYFDRGVCVFCGAAVEDQRPPSGHVISEMTELAEVVNAERAKTSGLREDLNITLADVAGQGTEIQASLRRLQGSLDQLDSTVEAAEQDLAPKDQALSELLASRSNIERLLGIHEQIERLERHQGELTVGDEPSASQGRDAISTQQLATLGTTISNLLNAWGVPDSTVVNFDPDTYDLIVGGQARSSRGKGIRAIFHSAYNLALVLHGLAIGQARPGFVVLDSPLITYRGPETAVPDSPGDEYLSQTVADAYFRYLASSWTEQVIVLENTDPPEDLTHAEIIYFTKSREMGRYGFFPPISTTDQLW